LRYLFSGIFYFQPNTTQTDEESSPQTSRRRRSSSNNNQTPIDVDKVDEEFCVVIKPPPPTPAPTLPPGEWVVQIPIYTNESIQYNISITNAKCLFWDAENATWTSNGCVVCFLSVNFIKQEPKGTNTIATYKMAWCEFYKQKSK